MLNRLLREGCEVRCPGCAHRLMSAQASESQKEGWLKRQLGPWEEQFAPIQAVQGEARWGYRDRVSLSTACDECGWQFGLIANRELIAIPHCPVHSQRVRETVRLLSRALPPGSSFPMVFYVQAGAQTTLVLKTAQLPSLDWVNQAFRQGLQEAGIEGLWLQLYPSAGRRLFTKRGWRLIWGKPRSVDSHDLTYGPAAFQQLIPALYRQALDEAEGFLFPTPDDSVIDLYCGIGASLVRWVRCGARTLGVELNGEAVECAQQNVPQASILRGTCKDRISQLDEWIAQQSDGRRLLYINPPRTGIEPEVLDWVVQNLRPAQIAYLSCSAGTLRRDLNVLDEAGYRVERIIPYDFFPQTYHVETLVLLRLCMS